MAALPSPRTLDPHQAPSLRWGILGTGWIAERFTASLRRHTTQRIQAVGSRTKESADRFAAAAGARAAYGSYEALVADPEVDIVYVATPHNLHHAHALLAIEAGNHVLVEKPLAVSAAEGSEIAAAATEAGVFCMEALWTLFLPKYDVLRHLLDDLRLDTVLADLGERFAPDHRIFRADLAGGPLYDLATYPLSIAMWALGGPPQRVTASGTPAANGVNGQLAITLGYADTAVAQLHSTILGATPTTAAFSAPECTIAVDGPFYQPGGFTVTWASGQSLRYDEPAGAHLAGLHFQAVDVARRIVAGEIESPIRPLADSVALLEVMDAIREQVGIPLPGPPS